MTMPAMLAGVRDDVLVVVPVQDEMRVIDVERCDNLPRGRALPVPLAPPYLFGDDARNAGRSP